METENKPKKKGKGGVVLFVIIIGLVLWFKFKPDPSKLPENKNYTPVTSQYLYNALPDDTMRDLYKKIQDIAYKYPSERDGKYLLGTIPVEEDMTTTQFFLAYRAFTEDHPEVFWLDWNTWASNSLDYSNPTHFAVYSIYSSDELKTLKAELDEALEQFLNDVPSGLSEREIQEYAHDYLIDNCEYDYDALDEEGNSDPDYINVVRVHNAIGALVDKKAVCQGYATAYQLLLNRLGVDCVQIRGTGSALDPELRMRTSKVNHRWNAVKNGSNWVMTDVTWDDSNDETRRHNYFNIPIEKMYKDHYAQAIDFSTYEYRPLGAITLYAVSDSDCLFLPE